MIYHYYLFTLPMFSKYDIPSVRDPIAYNMHHIAQVRKKNQRNKNQKRIKSRSNNKWSFGIMIVEIEEYLYLLEKRNVNNRN